MRSHKFKTLHQSGQLLILLKVLNIHIQKTKNAFESVIGEIRNKLLNHFQPLMQDLQQLGTKFVQYPRNKNNYAGGAASEWWFGDRQLLHPNQIQHNTVREYRSTPRGILHLVLRQFHQSN